MCVAPHLLSTEDSKTCSNGSCNCTFEGKHMSYAVGIVFHTNEVTLPYQQLAIRWKNGLSKNYFNDARTKHAHNGLTQKGNGKGESGLYSRLSFVKKCRTPYLDKTVHCLYKLVKNTKFLTNEIFIVALILKTKQHKWRCFKYIISSMFISQARGQMRTRGNLGVLYKHFKLMSRLFWPGTRTRLLSMCGYWRENCLPVWLLVRESNNNCKWSL